MSTSKAGFWVGGIFVVAFLISCASLFVVESVHAISSANLTNILWELLITYSAPAAALGAGIFAEHQSQQHEVRLLPFWTVIVVCGIWNFLLVLRCVQFGIAAYSPASGGLKDLLNYFEMVAKTGCFLTAPITYLFARPK